jgi:hypothetical protein
LSDRRDEIIVCASDDPKLPFEQAYHRSRVTDAGQFLGVTR